MSRLSGHVVAYERSNHRESKFGFLWFASFRGLFSLNDLRGVRPEKAISQWNIWSFSFRSGADSELKSMDLVTWKNCQSAVFFSTTNYLLVEIFSIFLFIAEDCIYNIQSYEKNYSCLQRFAFFWWIFTLLLVVAVVLWSSFPLTNVSRHKMMLADTWWKALGQSLPDKQNK